MDRYEHCANYDPNLLPQWQRFSKIEEKFLHLVQSLYKQETNSLLCGSAYAEADDEFLNKRRQIFLIYANPFMLRYIFPYDPDFCYEENIDSFSKMKGNLIAPLTDTDPGQVFSLSWDIDCLAQNPYKALLSWQRAFHKYMNLEDHLVLQRQTFCAFHESTLYLLCIFIPHTHHDAAFNPMQILSPLKEAFLDEIKAFSTLLDVYPSVGHTSQEQNADNKGNKGVIIYNYMMGSKSVWQAPPDFLKRLKTPLCQIFEDHIQKCSLSFNKRDYEDLTEYILEMSANNGADYYLFPFVCTRVFAQLFFDNPSKRMVVNALNEYETIDRLFDKHHRRIQNESVFSADKNTHPVIAFMLDVVSLCYEFGMTGLKILSDNETEYIKSENRRIEYEIMEQINTNWLALYLYGQGRLFDDPCICSHFCGLNLPIYLRALFRDEGDDDLWLNPSWIYALANINDGYDVKSTILETLSASCEQEFEKMSQLAPMWKEKLAEYIFDPSIWGDGRLNASSLEFQEQINGINDLINNACELLGKDCAGNNTPSMVIREIYIKILFEPVLDDLVCYLNASSSLKTHWKLFVQLTQNRQLMKECIDQQWGLKEEIPL